ncbi:MAG: FkbM family methyltransferase [Chlamydiales bacterium]
MLFSNRKNAVIVKSLFEKRHWVALKNMMLQAEAPLTFLKNYLKEKGKYPHVEKIRVRGNSIEIEVRSWHDLLTINEIFFRKDYPVKGDERCIVDFGSNIGVSALYFRSFAPQATLYLFEPVPHNILQIRENLSRNQLQEHVRLQEVAIGTQNGLLSFGIESSGRYGGFGFRGGETIEVQCREVNVVLESILRVENRIDLLKIDTEGNEIQLLKAIRPTVLGKIDKICVETKEHAVRLPHFRGIKRGEVFILTRKK